MKFGGLLVKHIKAVLPAKPGGSELQRLHERFLKTTEVS